MVERYSVLFKLEPNLYTEGAPLLISAGQLLKDNDTGAVLGQIKLQNIGPKTVSSATVRFEPFDPAGRPAGESFEHRYMDLNCARDAFCANREAAPFPDAAARRFNASVREVIFSDGSIWTMPQNALWETLPAPQVRKSFADKYAEKAYLSKFPGASKWKAEAVRDRWYCGCGVLNAGEEKSCHACKKEFSAFSVSEKDLTMQGKYAAANGWLKSGNIELLQQASALFKELGDYENAPAAAAEADRKISEILKKEKEAEEARAREEAERRAEEEARKKRKKRKKRRVIFFIMLLLAAAAYMFIIKPAMAYSSASSLLENAQYSEAKMAFLALETYKDSPQMAKECDYRAAKTLFDKGEYEKAKAAFKKLGNYSGAETMVTECDYQSAQALYAKKDYAGAYASFSLLKGYKDVDTLLATDDNLAAAAAAALDAAWQPGKCVTFGTYEQDNNKNNGKEAIEWLVLARNGSKALVLSKYGLDAKPYSKEWVDITWKICTLRSWLNGEFYNTAFTAAEQARIQLTSVDNSEAQGYSGYSTNGGNDTQDRVFLLSCAEANKYLGVTNSSNTTSRVSPTAYAKANGAYTLGSNKTAEGANAGCWWLRSPGDRQRLASVVDQDGSLGGYYVNDDSECVRPALWVEIS